MERVTIIRLFKDNGSLILQKEVSPEVAKDKLHELMYYHKEQPELGTTTTAIRPATANDIYIELNVSYSITREEFLQLEVDLPSKHELRIKARDLVTDLSDTEKDLLREALEVREMRDYEC